ncbi:hypothetical protein D3C84_837560 [compost metagenome]
MAETHKKILFRYYSDLLEDMVVEKGFDTAIIREKLKEVNCESEGMNETLFAVEITREVDYSIVKSILNEYVELSVIDFAEPCLSEKHRADLLKN